MIPYTLLVLLGFSIATILIYIITIIELWEIIERNKLVAIISYTISYTISTVINIANLVLTTIEYAYISSGFTTGIMSFFPSLIIKFFDAMRLDRENKEMKTLIEEKKRIPPILMNTLYDIIKDRTLREETILSMLTRIEGKHKSEEISEEQYKELRPIMELIGHIKNSKS